jgi:hypothetical protein
MEQIKIEILIIENENLFFHWKIVNQLSLYQRLY